MLDLKIANLCQIINTSRHNWSYNKYKKIVFLTFNKFNL